MLNCFSSRQCYLPLPPAVALRPREFQQRASAALYTKVAVAESNPNLGIENLDTTDLKKKKIRPNILALIVLTASD